MNRSTSQINPSIFRTGLLGFSLGLLMVTNSFQASAQTDTVPSRSSFFALPVVFYTPETRWGFGAAGIYTWRFKSEADSSRPSQVQPAFAYTLEDQILLYMPFQVWWDDERYTIFGELGWYRYNYFFYGIGNGVPGDFEELYGVNYPRLRLTAMYQFLPDFYAGLRMVADDFKITDLDPEGMLFDRSIPGSNGGLNAGMGLIINYDNRDNYLSTRKGVYGEFTVDRHGSFLSSDFTYTRFRFDFRSFYTIAEKNTFAFQLFSESILGEAPFISQALLGGTQKLRGFYEGRYRDKNSVLMQVEYRRDIIGRFGAVAFVALGTVSDTYTSLTTRHIRNTWGGGVRFTLSEKEQVKIRFDVGVGNGQPAFYLTIGEAF